MRNAEKDNKFFKIEVPAKWVLTGEHSVLRGKSAIAFPYSKYSLKLFSAPTEKINPEFQSLIDRALVWLGKTKHEEDFFQFEIESSIPIGAGLGSSAALCVALSRFVIWKTNSPVEDWIPLATHLEDVFHGKSSGMDVQVIALNAPILFSRDQKAIEFLSRETKLPNFELIDSGKRGQTRHCVEQVFQVQREVDNDSKMHEATLMAHASLLGYEKNPKASELTLVQAMNQAQSCFEAWSLVPYELIQQKQEFMKKGALAVKLTGSGMGGFWTVLWPSGS